MITTRNKITKLKKPLIKLDLRETNRPFCARNMRLLSMNHTSTKTVSVVRLAKSSLVEENIACSNILFKRYVSQQPQKKPKQQNHYNTLGVSSKATTAQIKQAYYRLSKIYHPDRNKSPGASVKFQEIQVAYDTLNNPRLRSQYDAELFKYMTRGGVVIPEIVIKESWRRASHPTGRAKMAFNLDEHMRKHYWTTFVREQRIKGEVKEHKIHHHKDDYHDIWYAEPLGYFCFLLMILYVAFNRWDIKQVKKRIEEGYYEDILTGKKSEP